MKQWIHQFSYLTVFINWISSKLNKGKRPKESGHWNKERERDSKEKSLTVLKLLIQVNISRLNCDFAKGEANWRKLESYRWISIFFFFNWKNTFILATLFTFYTQNNNYIYLLLYFHLAYKWKMVLVFEILSTESP